MLHLAYFFFFSILAAAAPASKPAPGPAAGNRYFCRRMLLGNRRIFPQNSGRDENSSGLRGRKTPNPTYEQTSEGNTGHAETVEILFDPKKVSYEALLDQFFKMHDPTTPNRQGNDAGTQYRSAIFTHGPEQMKEAKAFKEKVEKSKAWKKPIVTEIDPADKFYPAESYHQNYLVKNPGGYDNHYLRDLNFDK